MKLRMPVLLMIVTVFWTSTGNAQWRAANGNKLETRSAEAMQVMRERVKRSIPYFEDAYAMAVFPAVTRIGIGFGGAYGKGIVIEGDRSVATTKYWQFTSGIQGGIKSFSMVVFFKDKEALEYYKSSNAEFLGQAGLDFGTVGVAGTPAYNDGAAIITVTRLGLMGEFTISGAKFTYKPLQGAVEDPGVDD